MSIFRMLSPQNSVVERCIVDKVGIDGVVYEDGDRRVVLDQVQSHSHNTPYSDSYSHTHTPKDLFPSISLPGVEKQRPTVVKEEFHLEE